MKKPTKRNVSAPIWSKSFDAVSTRLRAVHIRRDAYLESLLGREIELLAQEIKGRNPEGAKQYINRSLRQLTKAEKCSLSLDQDLASRISGAAKKSNQTDHVVKRCQQRGIPPLVLDWLESHGDRPHDHHGAIISHFTARSWRALERENGREPMRRMSEWRNAYLVISTDGTRITAGHRHKKLMH